MNEATTTLTRAGIEQDVRLRREPNNHVGGFAAQTAVVAGHSLSRCAVDQEAPRAGACAARTRKPADRSAHVLRRSRDPLRYAPAAGEGTCFGYAASKSGVPVAAQCLLQRTQQATPRAGAVASATCSSVSFKARPNLSVEPRPNGGPPGPPSAVVYLAPVGPGVPPLVPSHLER
jgi:hypothetical protein